MSGWIKLHRQFKAHGHFRMPDRAMKIWFYILLTVAHKDEPRWGIRAGEGWISYDMIADECSAEGSRMSRKAIARELQWLEDNGYISRFVIKGKGQKIRVLNWDVYQATDVASSETEPEPELVPEPLPELVPEHIQEPKEPKERKEDPPLTPPPGEVDSSTGLAADVEEFHRHYCERWRDVFPRGPQLTRQRRRKITARLKSFSLEELKRAVDNLHDSAWHRGDNPDGKAYGTIDFLIRNDEQIDKWANTPPIRAAPFGRGRNHDPNDSVRKALARLEAMDRAAGEV